MVELPALFFFSQSAKLRFLRLRNPLLDVFVRHITFCRHRCDQFKLEHLIERKRYVALFGCVSNQRESELNGPGSAIPYRLLLLWLPSQPCPDDADGRLYGRRDLGSTNQAELPSKESEIHVVKAGEMFCRTAMFVERERVYYARFAYPITTGLAFFGRREPGCGEMRRGTRASYKCAVGVLHAPPPSQV